MFEQLNNRFAHIIKNIRGQGKITDDNISNTLRAVRKALLEADVNFYAAKSFIQRVKESASGEDVFNSVTPGQQFVKIILDELTSFLGSDNDGITFNDSGKTIILLAGLQGVGKTTTAVKLACFLKNKWQKNPLLIAADLQRPAAIDVFLGNLPYQRGKQDEGQGDPQYQISEYRDLPENSCKASQNCRFPSPDQGRPSPNV